MKIQRSDEGNLSTTDRNGFFVRLCRNCKSDRGVSSHSVETLSGYVTHWVCDDCVSRNGGL